MFLKRIQLGMIHVAVAMTLVPINSTLNRVMIKELGLSAALVAAMASLPYLFSPIQVAIGAYSDRHPILGLRRTPYIFLGLLLCVGGVAISPQVAFVLADKFWLGIILGVIAFGAWGMGYNLSAVSYLSLASELSGEKGRGRTIAVMWFMMIVGIILTAITLSNLVDPYTPEALSRAFILISLMALIIGLLGLVKLEKRSSLSEYEDEERYTWRKMAQSVLKNPQAAVFFWYLIILLAAILGQDILLEPFAAEAFGMPVKDTTRITSIWGVCVLAALLVAGMLEGRADKRRVAAWGGGSALVGFVIISLSGVILNQGIFYGGVVLLGLGTGLSTVSNLSLMLDMTTGGKVGLFIGTWGMANAISRLLGSVLGGIVRDIISEITQNAVLGYVFVFGIMVLMLLMSLLMLGKIDTSAFRAQVEEPSFIERASVAVDV